MYKCDVPDQTGANIRATSIITYTEDILESINVMFQIKLVQTLVPPALLHIQRLFWSV